MLSLRRLTLLLLRVMIPYTLPASMMSVRVLARPHVFLAMVVLKTVHHAA
jgi:hypothetical protein